MRRRSGQASIEFMTTYGWAFFVLVAMIGAMTYFGVLKTSSFIPERCNFGPDIICEDFQTLSLNEGLGSSRGIIMVALRQTFGRSAYLQGLSCEDLDFGYIGDGFYHLDGDDLGVGGSIMSAAFDPGSPPGVEIDALGDAEQWTPAELVTLKCIIFPNPFEVRAGEKIRIPITLSLKKRDNGFDHLFEGEVVSAIREETE